MQIWHQYLFNSKNNAKFISLKGTIIIEVQYLMNTLKDLTFDNIHEHYNYCH